MKFCLIGEKLSHSYSKEIHEERGLNYSLVELTKANVEQFVKDKQFNGYNVTIPYKKEIMPYLDYIDPTAKEVGAVNTVKVDKGKLYGYNTDILGMEYLLSRKGVSLQDKYVMILGTGGTSCTAVALAKRNGAKEIFVVGRNAEINYENCYDKTQTQIIINTTPVGMNPDLLGCPIDIGKFSNLQAVIDVIYNPQRTVLTQMAKELGLIYTNGLPMLVKQALLAQDIWLDKKHTDKECEQLISKLSLQKNNIVLVGMPGCGKSSVGEMLAKRLNRNFFDVDTEITKEQGKTPAEIITTQGEMAFRQIESQVLYRLCRLSGVVIACGGGSVISSQNRKVIKANAISVYLKRDLQKLSADNRPLSQTIGVQKLFEERRAYYEQADILVENEKSITNTVEEIIKEYENSHIKRT